MFFALFLEDRLGALMEDSCGVRLSSIDSAGLAKRAACDDDDSCGMEVSAAAATELFSVMRSSLTYRMAQIQYNMCSISNDSLPGSRPGAADDVRGRCIVGAEAAAVASRGGGDDGRSVYKLSSTLLCPVSARRWCLH